MISHKHGINIGGIVNWIETGESIHSYAHFVTIILYD
jgi:hypothetical protein